MSLPIYTTSRDDGYDSSLPPSVYQRERAYRCRGELGLRIHDKSVARVNARIWEGRVSIEQAREARHAKRSHSSFGRFVNSISDFFAL